ncbi:MAG: hypothetical protein HeimC3_22390 [Candidatus Heimdallarchaeota archaeon LC_3]|nr:MAG: hypothetical protein HeimC3_22390 [Candidatus Heimdallarchaeota archaeon LC_3]
MIHLTMQTILVPMYWESADKFGEVFLKAVGLIDEIEYYVNLVTVDPFTNYKQDRLVDITKILHSYLQEYPLDYLREILPIIFEDQNYSNPLSFILIVRVEDHIRVENSNINSNLVATSALLALNLCTSFGILNYTRFSLPNLDTPGELISATISGGVISYSATDKGLIRIIPPTKMNGYQINLKWLDKQYFNELIDFFNYQQIMKNENKLNFHNITDLIIDLFETTLVVKEYRPKFLLLAVIYETMFKKDNNEKIQKIS